MACGLMIQTLQQALNYVSITPARLLSLPRVRHYRMVQHLHCSYRATPHPSDSWMFLDDGRARFAVFR